MEETNEEKKSKAAILIQKRYREHAANKYNLTEKQKDFIRPWCKRWRTKSIFQVLLQYRAERLQTIVNFCLQIHLYNQNFTNDIQKTNEGINLNEVDLKASSEEYLSHSKPTVPKLLFKWESLKLRGDVSNCEKLPNSDMIQLESEILDKLIMKRLAILESNETRNSKHYEDKEIQACLNENEIYLWGKESPRRDSIKTQSERKIITEMAVDDNGLETRKIQKEDKVGSNLDSLSSTVSTMNQNAVLNITMIKNALDNLKRNDDLSPEEDCNDNFQETRIQALQSRPLSIKISNKLETKQNPKQELRNSISEMAEKFRNTNSDKSDDDPPFNFKAMLKKTNRKNDTRKASEENTALPSELNALLEKRRKSLCCGKFDQIRYQTETVSVELAPGILIHGKVTNL